MVKNKLPVAAALPEILSTLETHRRLVLHAPPGTGKSTTVPTALAGHFSDGDVRVAQPRRLAARELARFVAYLDGSQIGERIGYEVRFDKKVGRATKIRYVTNGLLLRQTLADPFLERTQVVVLDEFHERSVDSDLLVTMAKEIGDLRDDFYLVVMSATLETEKLSKFLDAPVVSVEAPIFPLNIERQKSASSIDSMQSDVQRALGRAMSETEGDILVFLPGVRDIRNAAELARKSTDAEVRELYGSLSMSEQTAALSASDRRRIIFSTNIAETSLTVEGVRVVIDSGWEKVNVFDPATGFNRLRTQRISEASATQRAGRAAREAPGHAFQLWTTAESHRFRSFRVPEIARTDVASHTLKSAVWSENVNTFDWYEPPPPGAKSAAIEELERIGALSSEGGVSELGRTLMTYPLHPTLAAFIDQAKQRDLLDEAALLTAVLAEPDHFRAPAESVDCDVIFRAKQITRQKGSQVFRVAKQIAGHAPKWTADDVVVRRLMFDVFFHYGAVKRGKRFSRFSGGSIVLGPSKVNSEYLLALRTHGARNVDGVQCGVVQYATRVEESWVEERMHSAVSVRFDSETERVSVFEERLLGSLVLSSKRIAKEGHQTAIQLALLSAVKSYPARAFTVTKKDKQFVARYERATGVSIFEDDDLLAGLISGCSSFPETRRIPIMKKASELLPYKVRTSLNQQFPATIKVPSGKNHAIDYLSDPPVLAVRIQELFGWEKVPDLGFKLMLHLLAPNYRPAQVTDDLASFWTNTYPEVRKELRARYPKHAWPEDPRAASAKAK